MDEAFHLEIMNLVQFLKIVYSDRGLKKQTKFVFRYITKLNLPLGVPSTLLHGPMVELQAIIE
jgi:hypothetical protein